MFTQYEQLGLCHSPELGEDVALRPDFWGQYRDSQAPSVSAGGVEHI